MKTEYTVFKPGDGPVDRGEIDLPDAPPWRSLRNLLSPILDDALPEHVAVLHDGKRRDMFVDEEGVVKGLPFNQRATAIYRNNWLTQHPGVDPDTLPEIRGVAILFHRIVWK